MEDKGYILQMIKESVHETDPAATVILFGSFARGEQREDSDIDLLILVDSDAERIEWDDERKITSPLHHIELQTGTIISPMVYSKKGWANHRVNFFYENVNREGIKL